MIKSSKVHEFSLIFSISLTNTYAYKGRENGEVCLRAAGVCLGGGGHTHYEVDEPDRRLGDDVSVPIVQWIHLPPPCAVYVALVVEFRVPACPGARVCALCCIVGAYSLPYIHVMGSRKPAYPTTKRRGGGTEKQQPQ